MLRSFMVFFLYNGVNKNIMKNKKGTMLIFYTLILIEINDVAIIETFRISIQYY